MKQPISFKIFIAVFIINVLVFGAATLLSYYQSDRKYATLLAFSLIVAFALTTVGIYTGFTFKPEDKKNKTLKRIGLIGNILIFLFILALMLAAAAYQA